MTDSKSAKLARMFIDVESEKINHEAMHDAVEAARRAGESMEDIVGRKKKKKGAGRALPRLLKADEVARQTSIPKDTVYQLAREGRIPHVRVGRAVRFSAAAVAEWIDSGGTTDK